MQTTSPRVLVISNGHGEDAIGAELVRRFPSGIEADAYPIAGSGAVFETTCPIVGPRSRSASGDLVALLPSIAPAIRFLGEAKDRYDKVVAIGDAIVLFLAWRAGLNISIHLDTVRSGHVRRYPAIEKWVIGKTCATVFCRDDMLAADLRKNGIDARSHGNVMMDVVPYGDYDVEARRIGNASIALLPGGGDNAPANLAMQVSALERVQGAGAADIFVALASGTDPVDLADATGLTWRPTGGGSSADAGDLVGKGLTLHLVAGAMGNVLDAADLVLAQAHMATQQALGLGNPVITFADPAKRPRRLVAEQAMMGESRMLVDNSSAAIAEAVQTLLDDPRERARRGAIGRERLGGAGTLDAVLAELLG